MFTGRLPSKNAAFDNRIHAKKLNGFSELSLDKDRIEYFLSYRRANFSDEFKADQGIEPIFDAIQRHSKEGVCFDLASGPSTLFWLIPSPEVSRVICADISPEALMVMDDFRKSDEVPKCYRQALGLCSAHERSLFRKRWGPWDYYVFDMFAEWPPFFRNSQIDTVLAFGALGIAKSDKEYAFGFNSMVQNVLGEATVVIGAEWIRRESYLIGEDGADLRYMTIDFLRDVMADTEKGSLIEISRVPIKGDPVYEYLIVWVVRGGA